MSIMQLFILFIKLIQPMKQSFQWLILTQSQRNYYPIHFQHSCNIGMTKFIPIWLSSTSFMLPDQLMPHGNSHDPFINPFDKHLLVHIISNEVDYHR
jgi:hypothetical protein